MFYSSIGILCFQGKFNRYYIPTKIITFNIILVNFEEDF